MGLRIYDTVCSRRAASPTALYGRASVKSKEMRNGHLSTTPAPGGHADKVLEHDVDDMGACSEELVRDHKRSVLAESAASVGGAAVRRDVSNAGRGEHCKVAHRARRGAEGEVEGRAMRG